VAAAAAFLEARRDVTVDPTLRADRALAAASAKIESGAFGAARDCFRRRGWSPQRLSAGRIELVEAELAFLTNRGSEAPRCC